MKLSTRVASILMAGLILIGSAAFADSIHDPKIIIGDPVCSADPSCVPEGSQFNFDISGGPDQTLTFGNASGHNWYQLLLTWNPADEPLANVSAELHGGVLDFWSWERVDFGSSVGILFFSASPDTDPMSPYFDNLPPLAPGEAFTMDFAPVGNDKWPAMSFSAAANTSVPVPEPGSLALIFSTVAFLSTRRKLWKSVSA